MPTVCVVRHCGTTYRSGNDVRFHKLPSEPRRRAAWLRAINRNGPQIGFVCSNHFLPEDYEMNLDVLRSLGMATKNARLRRDAVPTQRLHIASLKKRRRSEASEARPPPPWSEELRSSRDVAVGTLAVKGEQLSPPTVENSAQTSTTRCSTVSCQTDGCHVQTRYTQVNLCLSSTFLDFFP